MLKRYWRWITRAGIAIFAVLTVAYITWAVSFFSDYKQAHEDQRQEIASKDQQSAEENMDWRCNVLAAFFGAECQPKDQQAKQADPYAQADLRAQQNMAEWALIVALVSVPGLIVSSLGLWALYWTFAQTREIAKSQQRAFLYAFALEMDPPHQINGSIDFNLGITNVGETHAVNVEAEGILTIDPGATEGREHGIVRKIEFKSASTDIIAAKADGVVFGFALFDFAWEGFNEDPKLYPMTGDCRRESISFTGRITWTDAFGDTQSMPFSFNRHYLKKDTFNWFSAGPDGQTGRDFRERYENGE